MVNICLDCDDTLYDLSWPFWKTMEQFFPDFQPQDTALREQIYQDYRKFGDDLFDLLQAGVITPDDSGILRIVKLCKAYGLHIDVMDAWEFQKTYKKHQYEVKMDQEFFEFLKAYPGKKSILTNGQTEHQRNKVHSLKADQVVSDENIFVSQQVGFRKPDPRAFLSVMERMNEKPEDWYYIGDSYENDMEGAHQAGMKTIYLNRHHRPDGPCSDYTVYTEKQLMDLLQSL